MTSSAWGLLALFLVLLGLLAWPVGKFLAALCNERVPRWMQRVEAPLYRLSGTRPEQSMHWLRYAFALLAFNAIGAIFVYALQRLQAWLPLNPAGMAAVSPDSAFNTAVSFVSNTNWQGYAGESTMSYLTQMLGLTVQNFFSAATGIAVAFALVRGFARRGDGKGLVGNFWADITRLTLWVLVPISFVLAVVFAGQGVIQNFDAYKEVSTLETTAFQQPKNGADGQPLKDDKGQPVMEDATTKTQTLAMGPVASQEAIKMLGTNGGGFFNANSAHPYENPTALVNLLQMIAIFLIPAALCFTFGHVVGDMRQGWAVLAAMTVMFVVAVIVITPAEQAGNPLLTPLGVDQMHGALQAGGNMEGKEVRFGIVASSLFAVITTAASCGAVNAMHDSFTALGGMIPLINMQLGEIIIGGVGAGLYGMLLFVVLAIFVAGLMVGRTPEYVGKKIEAREVKMAMLAILVLPLMYLGWTAVGVVYPAAVASMANAGPHGFTEVLYAFTSATGNNGSAFAGLTGNTLFYNLTLASAMFVGRFFMIVPAMAIAGSLAAKKSIPPSAGTFPTTGGLFVGLVVGVILIIGGLTFFPALALGPIVEHLAMNAGQVF